MMAECTVTKILGKTTSAKHISTSDGGVSGVVVSAIHKPSGQIVAVKRYKLDVDGNIDNMRCSTMQEKFHENVSFILVRLQKMPRIPFPCQCLVF